MTNAKTACVPFVRGNDAVEFQRIGAWARIVTTSILQALRRNYPAPGCAPYMGSRGGCQHGRDAAGPGVGGALRLPRRYRTRSGTGPSGWRIRRSRHRVKSPVATTIAAPASVSRSGHSWNTTSPTISAKIRLV